MKELKPCPFCGGKDIIIYHTGLLTVSSRAECLKCGCGTYNENSDEEAIENWNRRVVKPVPLVDVLSPLFEVMSEEDLEELAVELRSK